MGTQRKFGVLPARLAAPIALAALLAATTLGAVTAVGADDLTTADPGPPIAEETTSPAAISEPAPESPTSESEIAEPQTTESPTGEPADDGVSEELTLTAAATPAVPDGDVGVQNFDGGIFSTDGSCTGVNVNDFDSKPDVYLDGGPQNQNANGLPEGDYFVQVTTPNGVVLGKTLLATAHVDATGNFAVCYQLVAILYTASSGFTVLGFDDTTNNGGEYKVWLSPLSDFPNSDSKTDNFKVLFETEVTTEVHDGSHTDITGAVNIPAGTPVHDQATVTGGAQTPSGTVDFAFFTNSTCDGTPDNTESGVALDGSGVAESTPVARVAGSYSYLVTYSGDGTHLESTGVCEPFTVIGETTEEPLDPSAVTEVHRDSDHNPQTVFVVGENFHDLVTVSGTGPMPTGTADFAFFGNGECSGQPLDTESNISLDVAGEAESSARSLGVVGNASYLVHYDGDVNYNPADAACEPLNAIEVEATTTIIVRKVTQPDPDATGPFPVTVQSGNTGFNDVANLPAGGAEESFIVPEGTGYSVSEAVPSGWTLEGIVCDADGTSVDPASFAAQGGTITCVVTNSVIEVGGVSVTNLPFTGSGNTNDLVKIGVLLALLGLVALLAVRDRKRAALVD